MLVRWSPLNEFGALRRQMDDLFGRTFDFWREYEGDQNLELAAWRPAVDIHEDEQAYTLTAEVPGMTQKEIKIHVANGQLTMEGERKQEHEEKKGEYRRVERSYGKFSRTFTLPGDVDVAKIDARCTEGVLKLTLPKKEEAKPKQIEVKVH